MWAQGCDSAGPDVQQEAEKRQRLPSLQATGASSCFLVYKYGFKGERKKNEGDIADAKVASQEVNKSEALGVRPHVSVHH